jgi:taurine dioxygenase
MAIEVGEAPAVLRTGAARSLKATRLTVNIGAEVTGVSLGDAARDAALFAEIKTLLLQHKVLFFRDQNITRAEHVAFASRFGDLEDHPMAGSDPDHPGLVQVYRDLIAARENVWHCDGTWREAPPMGAVLRCIECPATGGDTMWSNMVKAYEDLPDHIKTQIASLRARHSIEATFGSPLPTEERHALKDRYPDAEHPVVRTHPETGEKILYVGAFSTHFTNFLNPTNVKYGQDFIPGSANLMNYLTSRAGIPEYQVRWKWSPNSVAVWDNRSTQHYAVQDYWPAPRKMERASIIGDRPY